MTNDGKWAYTYDYENRLIKAENSSLTAIYTYDSYGRRIHKDIRDSSDVLVSSTSYLYDGAQVITEYDETDTLLRKYIYGPGIDEPILIENTIGDRYYYHYDGLGSITELTDSAGSIVEKYTYDVYGKTTIRNAQNEIINTSIVDNPYAYTGRRLDTETGLYLYYYRARHYNPETGRFQQTDPIGYYDSMNLYQYCFNNPVNWIDPWGEDTYYINNNFMTDKPTNNFISHSFVAITDIDPVTRKEKVVKTFSWVSSSNGEWEDPCNKQNMLGAKKAIDSGIGVWKRGDETLDKYVDLLYEERKNEKGEFWGNRGVCKTQANRLIEDAKIKKAEDLWKEKNKIYK